KSLLDPFLPEQPRDVERLTTVQRDIHDAFKALVRTRRGARLSAEESKLFTGEIFVGRRAVSLGLADGIGDLRGVLRQRFGDRVRLRPCEPERRRFSLFGRGRPRGLDVTALVSEAVAFVEERLLWSRFGL